MAERRNRRNVTILYGENRLQNTISLPATATVRKAKEIGSTEMIKHLQLQSGVPSDITIDECTDVYPRRTCYRRHFVARSRESGKPKGNHHSLAEIYNDRKHPHTIPHHECTQQQNR